MESILPFEFMILILNYYKSIISFIHALDTLKILIKTH